jgi:uncharacterized protein HemY
MNDENIGVVVIFVVFIVAVIVGSMGESHPPLLMSKKEITYLRVPAISPISP